MVVRRVVKREFLSLIRTAARDDASLAALQRFVEYRYVGEEYDDTSSSSRLEYEFESEGTEKVFDCVAYHLTGAHEEDNRERWAFLARALQSGAWSSARAMAALSFREIAELYRKRAEGLIVESVFRNGISALLPPVGGLSVDEVLESYATLRHLPISAPDPL